MKKLLLSLALLSGMMLASETKAMSYYEARARMEREVNYICSTSIGVGYGTSLYYECRDYYDRKFYEYGLDWDYLTAAQITDFLTRTNPYIRQCRNRGLISTLLWGCIRDYEDGYYRNWYHRHPHFKPKHDYRPHFENRKGPAPKPHHAEPPKPNHAGPAPKPHHAEQPKPKHVEQPKPRHAEPAPKPKHAEPAPKPNDNRGGEPPRKR